MHTFSEFLERHTDFIKNAKRINFQWYQIEIVTKLVRDHFDFDERVKVYDVINSYLASDDVSNSPYARTLKQNRRPSEAELKKLRGSIFYEVVGKITAMKTERKIFHRWAALVSSWAMIRLKVCWFEASSWMVNATNAVMWLASSAPTSFAAIWLVETVWTSLWEKQGNALFANESCKIVFL